MSCKLLSGKSEGYVSSLRNYTLSFWTYLRPQDARKRTDRSTGTSKPVGLKPSLHSLKQSRENPETQPDDAEGEDEGESEDADRPAKKRRFSQPLRVDESGELVDLGTRKSRRSATVKSKKELHEKLKDEQEKRVRSSLSSRYLKWGIILTFSSVVRVLHSGCTAKAIQSDGPRFHPRRTHRRSVQNRRDQRRIPQCLSHRRRRASSA